MVRHWTPKPVIIFCIRLSPTGGNFFLLLLIPLNKIMTFLPILYKLKNSSTSSCGVAGRGLIWKRYGNIMFKGHCALRYRRPNKTVLFQTHLFNWSYMVSCAALHGSFDLRVKTHRASSGSGSGKDPFESIVTLQNESQTQSQVSTQAQNFKATAAADPWCEHPLRWGSFTSKFPWRHYSQKSL